MSLETGVDTHKKPNPAQLDQIRTIHVGQIMEDQDVEKSSRMKKNKCIRTCKVK